MFAVPASFFAKFHKVQMAGRNAPWLLPSRTFRRHDPMRQPQIIRSNTFRWALAVAGVLAVFVMALFAFIYWKTDHYLVARSDAMIASQLNYVAGLPNEREQLDALDQHLKQDSRGVQYAGLFDAYGRKIAGNLERPPPELRVDDEVQSVSVERVPSARDIHVIRAISR